IILVPHAPAIQSVSDLNSGKVLLGGQLNLVYFPCSILYSEGWLLRAILYFFSKHQVTGHALSFIQGAEWYSEGLLKFYKSGLKYNKPG
ncbi:MAG: hypothetical protein ACQES4_11735, partial [Bacillota bacterium]